MTPAEKAKETRRLHQETQRQLWTEKREAIKTARKGLLRVMGNEAATPTEVLEAARLLAELGKY